MAGRLLTTGLVCFLLAAGAAMFFGPLLRDASPGRLPPCPYTESGDLDSLPAGTVAAVGAYEAIRETLARGSIEGIAAQAGVIAGVFSAGDPKMASLAKRLAAEQDVESARRTFLRMHRLMERQARRMPRT